MTSFFNQTGITNSISGSAQAAKDAAEASKNAAAASATAAAASAAAAAASASSANANASNVTTVAGISGDVTALAGIESDITTLAASGVVADMDALADITSDITTLAGKSAEIGRLGTADAVADMNTLGTAAIVADMDALADIASDITTVADNVSGVNNFASVYRVGASDPTTSLDTGDLFYNTTSSTLKVYSGTGWEQGVTAGSGFLPLTGGTLTGSLLTTGTVNGRDVDTDGTKLDGIETGATADQTASEILTAIKTVDGASSGLDADQLDGQEGSYYLDANNFSNMPSGYSGWSVSDGTNSESIADGDTLTFSGATYDTATNTVTIASADLTNLSASNLTSGTIPDARFPATLPAVSGANLTGISTDLVGDTTPQLGGNLDTNGNAILFGSSKWSIELDTGDNDLLFKYNGTTVFKLASNGAVTSADDVTAFGTP